MKKYLLLASLLLCTRPALAASIDLVIMPGAGTTSHRIERAVDDGVFARLVDLTRPVVTYTDSDVTAGHTYHYRVVAYTGTAPAAPSAVCTSSLTVSASTMTCKPAP